MERCIGTSIPPGMIVHHVNEDRTDNRPENLKLMTHAEHAAHHNQKHPLVKQCEVCGRDFTPAPTKRARAKTCGARACVVASVGRNQRSTERVTMGAECLTLAEWSTRTGIKADTIRWRLRRGWSPSEALCP
jgi:hypothetical protein